MVTEDDAIYHVDETKGNEKTEVVEDSENVVTTPEAHWKSKEEVNEADEVPGLLGSELLPENCWVDCLEKVDRGFNYAHLVFG